MHLEKFYIVTVSGSGSVSLYEAEDEDDRATLTKIKVSGQSGIRLGDMLSGRYISVGQNLMVYSTGKKLKQVRPDIGDVAPGLLGGNTSAIAGLFKNRADAELCYDACRISHAVVVYDRRWAEHSREILNILGRDKTSSFTLRRRERATIRSWVRAKPKKRLKRRTVWSRNK